MPTDAFWQEWLATRPEVMLDAIQKRLMEFPPDQRPEALQEVIQAARRTVIPEEAEEKLPTILPIPVFLEQVGTPPPALVEEFLPANKLVMLGGLPKEGKTLITLQILQDICKGDTMMERFAVNTGGPKSVIYFGLEAGEFELKRLILTRGNNNLDRYYVCGVGFNMQNERGWEHFEAQCASVSDLVLVVIDTDREAFWDVRDWNDQAELTPILRRLRSWAQSHCTVIMLHHFNKSPLAQGVNRFTGTNAITSGSDCLALLEDQQVLANGNLRWKYTLTGRSLKKVEYRLEMDTNTLHVRCLTDDEVMELAQENKTQVREDRKSRLLSAAHRLGRFTIAELANDVRLSQQYVRELVKDLVAEKEVIAGEAVRSNGRGPDVQVYQVADLYG